MAKTVIKVENVSKVYRLGEIGTGSLGSDVNRWWVTKILGREDPYLKIGQTNDRATKGDSDVVYSLRDVSFEVQQGEVLGIIGKNGAGKSTLLKILSRITAPTTGTVKMKGRVASLLEVGTGFHPELTGRENIFLNGSILGMRKHEIARKLDEIIDFSGVERYIDTPVKRYSSGMYVRLAFAVAAYLESEILIVDEVLAVGDTEFQKKCLNRMKDVSLNEGRTVLFVSHNLFAVSNLCDKAILIKAGNLESYGPVDAVIKHYDKIPSLLNSWRRVDKSESDVYIDSVEINLIGNQPNLKLKVLTQILVKKSIANRGFLAYYISSSDSAPIMEAIPNYTFIDFNNANVSIDVESVIELNGLIPGTYFLGIWMGIGHYYQLDWIREVVAFDVTDNPLSERMVPYPKHAGHIVPFSAVTLVDQKPL